MGYQKGPAGAEGKWAMRKNDEALSKQGSRPSGKTKLGECRVEGKEMEGLNIFITFRRGVTDRLEFLVSGRRKGKCSKDVASS